MKPRITRLRTGIYVCFLGQNRGYGPTEEAAYEHYQLGQRACACL